MSAADTWRRLSLGEVLPEPERYPFSWPGDDAGLRESLARHGQLRPLLVLWEAGPRPVLAAGYRRAAILQGLGEGSAWVRLVAPPADRRDLWALLLEDHLAARPLNPVEVGLYARRRTADTGEGPDDFPPAVFERLGLPPRPRVLDDFLWIADLPPRHRDAFASGRLPLQGVRVLSRAPRDDALALLDLLAGAAVGVNKLSELARWALECAWGRGVPLDRWLAQENLAAFSGRPDRLRLEVRRRRYPELSAWEESFREDARALGLPSGARLSHAPSFEGGRLSCTLSFAALGELEEALETLLGLLRQGRLDPLGRYLG
ncbi:MAG: ParB/RepB/Spo0J family partition protein [Deferrisomatales bacterium]